MSLLDDHLTILRRQIATAPVGHRLTAFANAANDLAGLVFNNDVPKGDVVDALYDMARAHDFMSAPESETIVNAMIFEALGNAEQNAERIPPALDAFEDLEKTNGQGKPHGLGIQTKAQFIKGFVPPDYLIDGILQRKFLYAITGQTGHAKTAVALLIAQLVSSSDYNATLGNHRVDKGRVVYFVGENADDVRMRVIGIDSKRIDDPTSDNISFIPQVFDIEKTFPSLEADAKANGEIALIIIDTSAAYFPGNEELSNTQMGAYARSLRRLTTLPGGPCVLVLCHPIKHVQEPSQLLPRGGGAYLAEVDGNLTLWRVGDEMVELYHNKLRGPGFQAMTFRLESIRSDALKDKKGRQITTVRAVTISQSEEEKQSDREKKERHQVLAQMLVDPDGSLAAWATAIGWQTGGEPHKKKVQRICEKLQQPPKYTTNIHGKWSLTEEGKKQAREAALKIRHDRELEANREAQADLDFARK